MDSQTAQAVGIAALALAALVAAGLLVLLRRFADLRAARRLWRMRNNAAFAQGITDRLRARGYSIAQSVTTDDGEVILDLHDGSGLTVAAVIYPGLFPVTSDQIGVLTRAMRGSRARHALLFTRSIFSPAAIEAARGLSITLVDRRGLRPWLL